MLPLEKVRAASTYQLFGLDLRSEIDLSGLAPSASVSSPDVEIRLGRIDVDGAVPGYSTNADGTVLFVPKVGTYLVRDGRQIVVDPAPGASDRNVRLFLIGSAFGALLHQRDLMPLHANAVLISGRAVAFCGHSGAGKSTIAAWFHDHGHQVLADDVCVIGSDEDGTALARPGPTRLRLWREALEARGRVAEDYEQSFDDMDKYDVPTWRDAPSSPSPLAAIYLLRRAPENTHDPVIRRLNGVDAVDALVSNTYRGGYVRMMGQTGPHLARCLRIAKAVPIFQADRVWGFENFDTQVKFLEDHARRIAELPTGTEVAI